MDHVNDNPQTPPVETRGRSYIARHWRGELTLATSFFVNGVLVNIAFNLAIFALTSFIDAIQIPIGIPIAMGAIWLIVICVAIWQFVGIWRSAGKHSTRGGLAFWGVVARIMVILGVFQTISLVVASGVPQMREFIDIARGDANIGPHTIRILNNGSEVELAGGITIGLTAEIEQVLAAHPDVRTIHLNSNGGRVVEAERLRDLIARLGLDTFVASECLSACTIAFLGGTRRFLDPHAKLGFHSGNWPGMFEGERDARLQAVTDDAVERGVTEDFAEKAFLSAPQEFWFPSTTELVDAGFVTELSNGQFGISGFGVNFTELEVELYLRTIPLFDAIERADPALFDVISLLFYDAAQVGTPFGEVSSSARAMMGGLLIKIAPQASNAALTELNTVLVEELRALEAADADACYAYLFPADGNSVDLRNYLSAELWQRELEVAEKVLASGAANEALLEVPVDTDAAFAVAFERLTEKHGDEVISDVIALSTDHTVMETATVCRTVLRIYEAVLTLPPNEAAALMRELLLQGQ